MGLLPFDVSYILFTPRRVRLPGEPVKSPSSPSSPTKFGGANSQSMRLRGNGPPKSKSFRSLLGSKSSNNLAALAREKRKEEVEEERAST